MSILVVLFDVNATLSLLLFLKVCVLSMRLIIQRLHYLYILNHLSIVNNNCRVLIFQIGALGGFNGRTFKILGDIIARSVETLTKVPPARFL